MEQDVIKLSNADKLKKVIDETYKNSFVHLLGNGTSIFFEYILYLISASCLLAAFIVHKIFPFHILGEIVNKRELLSYFSNQELLTFNYAVRALFILISMLFFYIGFQIRQNRIRNEKIQLTAKELKEIYQESLDIDKMIKKQDKEMGKHQENLHRVELHHLENIIDPKERTS